MNDRIEITLTDDATIAELAGRFRGNPHATDVLAFTYDGDPELSGEVVISVDTARRQAEERGALLQDEILLLIVHGVWHIRGQGDETKRDWCRMRVREFETLVRVVS
jgi:probable rRNA maturation factor